MSVKLVWITPTAEQQVVYCARVSNPTNQNNAATAPRLLRYLIDHKHWSPFEMASACFELKTSRAIAAQILRHRSFAFQEFSQRYSEATNFISHAARAQDHKNKQASHDTLPEDTKDWFNDAQKYLHSESERLYRHALSRGVAKECARFLLPLSTETTIYMAGTLRSWLHYAEVRCDKSTQLEHRVLAEAIRDILAKELPSVAEALEWPKTESISSSQS